MTSTVANRNSQTDSSSKQSEWFDNFIHSIEVERLKLETGLANTEEKRFFHSLINEDMTEAFKVISNGMHKLITQNVIMAFLSELINVRNKKPKKIAFDLLDKEIHVWAEIEENDEETENAIYLAEAKTLYDFKEIGYRISATVVEDSDNLSVPIQYIKVAL